MGQASNKIHNVGSLAFGTLWPLSGGDGQRNSTASKRFTRTAPSEVPLRENDTEGPSSRPKPLSPLAEKAHATAFRSVYAATETLRLAAIKVYETVLVAEEAGVQFPDIVNALRIDNVDWDKEMDRMQVAAALLQAVGAPTSLDILILTDNPVAKGSDLEAQAELDGYLAAVIGKHRESCDLVYKTEAWHRWMLGFKKAQADIKSDKETD